MKTISYNLFFVLLLCTFATVAFAQGNNQNVAETIRSAGLTGKWAPDCSKPASPSNIHSEIRTVDGKSIQFATQGQHPIQQEFLDVKRTVKGYYEVRTLYKGASGERILISELLIAGSRLRTMSTMFENGKHIVVDGVVVANQQETPWLTRCD